MIVAKFDESLQEYRNDCPDGYVVMQSPRPEGNYWVAGEDGSWVQSQQLLAEATQSEMVTEVDWADIEIKKHTEGHTRTVATLEELYAYKNACRDYVRNIDGVLTIVGDKPIRPQEGA